MTDTDWYLLDRSGRRHGPYDRELVEQLASRRELQAATPVWHPGLARWQRADRVLTLPKAERSEATAATTTAPAPASAPRQTKAAAAPRPASAARPVRTPARVAPGAPPARPAPVAKPRGASTAGAAKIASTPMSTPQAARRALAAALDLLLMFVAWRLVGGRLALDGAAVFARAPLFFAIWALADAALTVRLGATPGRAVMAIRIRGADDQPLSWPRALIRSGALPLLLLFASLRTGFTLFVAVIALIFTARRLREGFAPWWDDIAGARVSYGELTAPRKLLAGVAFLAGLLVMLAAA